MIFYPKQLKGKSLMVDDDVEVRYTETGGIIRYSVQSFRCRQSYIKLLPHGQYMDRRTGEVKDRQFRAKSRQDNLKNVRKSMQEGRDLINANVRDLRHTAWVTFTYAQNMTDTKKLYNDWKNFNRDYRKIVGDYEYITAVEPQRRGAWHIHAFLIFPFECTRSIDYDLIRKTWGKGRVHVQYPEGNVDNLGAYMSAYLCNLDLAEKAESAGNHHDIDIVVCERTGKMYEKRQRLGMYPANTKIFRRSSGIVKPETKWVPIKEADKKIKALAATKTFETYSEHEFEFASGQKHTQTIYTQYFNTAVRESQPDTAKNSQDNFLNFRFMEGMPMIERRRAVVDAVNANFRGLSVDDYVILTRSEGLYDAHSATADKDYADTVVGRYVDYNKYDEVMIYQVTDVDADGLLVIGVTFIRSVDCRNKQKL